MLYGSKLSAGLGVPNLQAYYEAAQIAQLSYTMAKGSTHLWVSIEALSGHPFAIGSLMWLPSRLHPPILCPTLSRSLAVWDGVKHLKPLSFPHTPCSATLIFPPQTDSDAIPMVAQQGAL